ncbi:MAG: hypothetical protein U9O87_06540 [Verrucomicrobiota bacterium]|nr:hypothetical protein [Verrucomicrobiota bacterium]
MFRSKKYNIVFLALTLGVPFSIFKIIGGRVIVREFGIFGYFLICVGIIDLLLNLCRSFQAYGIFSGKVSYCFFSTIGNIFSKEEFFLGIDTLFSFFIVVIFLWSNLITKLTSTENFFWVSAVTVNVLAVGFTQLWCAYHLRD